jgi:hypothetical protein
MRPGLSPPYSQPPDRARQVSLLVLNFVPPSATEELEKCLLGHVLGLVRAARNCQGNAKDKPRMPLDQFSKRLPRAFPGVLRNTLFAAD